MTQAIALTKAKPPEGQSGSDILTAGASRQHAALELYEAKPATGGSKPASPLKPIAFQFNPKEVTITKSAKWGKSNAKNAKKSGPPEFQGADPCKLTLEMFFDSTLKSDQSVVDSVEKLLSCCVPLEKDRRSKPMPPLVRFKWGRITSFPAYVTQVSVKYTRFASNGVPIRALCTVNLEEMPSEASGPNPTSGVLAVDRVHTFVAGDTLALVAYHEYGDPAMWRPLADYNGVDDPMRIPAGTRLLLPAGETLLA